MLVLLQTLRCPMICFYSSLSLASVYVLFTLGAAMPWIVTLGTDRLLGNQLMRVGKTDMESRFVLPCFLIQVTFHV